MVKAITVTKKVTIGGEANPFILIAGVCVIENEKHTLKIAGELIKITTALDVPFIFKASYDKANRSSVKSYRGVGIVKGLGILKKVKKEYGIPILTDVHTVEDVARVALVCDVVQIPAFLSRQTDLIVSAAKTGRVVNIKKGQFLAPWDMPNVIEKIEAQQNKKIIITERGYTFGYNNLVTDFRAIPIMRSFSYPVVFDATHSVQLPGGNKSHSGGERQFVLSLSRAAAAVGIDGLFLEIHDNPDKALCDGPNAVSLKDLPELLEEVRNIDRLVKKIKKK